MEGEPDRGEDGDSPEGATDGLDDHRDELRKRHPDSANHDQGEVRHGAVDASEQHDSASTIKVADEASEAGRRLELANTSPDAEGRSEPDALLRSDYSDEGKERAAEHPEHSAELEGQNELERLRGDLKEKYPESEASHGIKPDELKESRAAAESENLGRDAMQATPSEAENQERGVPADAGRSEAGRKSDSSSESYAGEDARPELEQLRKEINEKEKGRRAGEVTPRKEDSISSSSLEKDAEDKERGKTVVSGSEIRDSGGKIDSAQTDSESSVRSEKSTRDAGFDVHEQASSANADRFRALEGSAANKIPYSRSATEGKEVGKISDEEHVSRKEIKAAAGNSGGDSRAIGEGQTPLAKEAGTGLDKSSKSGKELADLEKIGASNKEQVNSQGKDSQALRSPRASYSESSRQEKLDRADAIPVRAQLRQSNPVVIRFDIPKQAIEEKTGVRMEEEKLFHIKGSVGKYDFEMYRTASSYIRHSVPVEHHHQIQHGEVHDISISSMKEVPLTKAQSKLVSEWRNRGVPWNRIAYRINHMKPEAAEQQIQPAQHSGVGEKKKLHQLEKLERVDNIGATFVAVARFHGKDKVNHEDRFYFRIRAYPKNRLGGQPVLIR